VESATDYSVVIACYNSGEWLEELIREVSKEMNVTGKTYEIILVNDSSTDGTTWSCIQRTARKNDRILGIDLMANSGQFSALLCGMRHSTGEFVITMDDDFQNAPDDISTLIEAIEENEEADGIIADWRKKRHRNLIRLIGSRVYHKSLRFATGTRRNVKMNSFRILRRRLVNAILQNDTSRPVMGGLLIESSDYLENVELAHRHGRRKKSGYKLIPMINITLANIVYSTTKPLKIMAITGSLVFFMSMVMAVYFTYMRLVDGISVDGYASVIVAISIFGGLTLIGLGIIGEYVGRIVHEVRGTPQYNIRRTTQVQVNDESE